MSTWRLVIGGGPARCAALAAGVWLAGASAHAQSEEGDPPAEVEAEAEAEAQPTPAQIESAASAFSEGQRAQLRGDPSGAAEMFELAFQSAPAAGALRAAIRAHIEAGNTLRAATLALTLQERFADDEESAALASETLAALSPQLFRVRLRCSPACSVAVDGRAAIRGTSTHSIFFVPANAERLGISWAGRPSRTLDLDARAGGSTSLHLEAPAAVEVEADVDVDVDAEADAHAAPVVGAAPASRGISPAFFGVSLAVTALVGGFSIGSGVDTLMANDAYIAMPTMGGYEDGVARELRTNLLFVGTGVAAAVTALLLAFTDFGGRDDEAAAARPTVSVDPVLGELSLGVEAVW